MTYEQIAEMMEEMGLPFAYHHFAEGESPAPPFLLFLSPGENTFSADNLAYFSCKQLDIELYTDKKQPELEEQVETVLSQHEIYYTKTETFIDSEELYEDSMRWMPEFEAGCCTRTNGMPTLDFRRLVYLWQTKRIRSSLV